MGLRIVKVYQGSVRRHERSIYLNTSIEQLWILKASRTGVHYQIMQGVAKMAIPYTDHSTFSLRKQEWTISIEVPELGYHDYNLLMSQLSSVLDKYEKYVPEEDYW